MACVRVGRSGIAQTARLLDGVATSAAICSDLARETQRLAARGVIPGLGVVLVGERADSLRYVRAKQRMAHRLGFRSFVKHLSSNCEESDVLASIEEFNSRSDVHGVLVQLPIPKHLYQPRIVGRVSIAKDVDGFHPSNVGLLALNQLSNLYFQPWETHGALADNRSQFETPCSIEVEYVSPSSSLRDKLHGNVGCAPKACLALLDQYEINVKGENVAVIGRSNIVGVPMSLLLLHRGATLINISKESPIEEMAELCRRADVIIAAAGVPRLVQRDWIKPGAAVVDVGMNYEKNGNLVGDVDFDEVSQVAGYISPVPNGVGPVTVAMLMENTLHNCIDFAEGRTEVHV